MDRILAYFILLVVCSCTDEVHDPIDAGIYGYEYYPLEVGTSRTYKIDSIQFDVGAGNLPTQDSSTFYLREDVVELIEDLEGKDVYRVERYRAESPQGPWSIFDVITQSRTINQAFYTENNVRLINLVFPIRKGVRWKGDAFVKDRLIVFIQGESLEMYKGWDFRVLSADSSEILVGQEYQEVATIQQADSDNPIERRYSLEKYAKGIGLVFRERQIVDSYCKQLGVLDQCLGKEWIEKAGRGFFTREVLIDHN